MTTTAVTASFMLSDGTIADMASTITDEATDQQLLTSTTYSVAAVTIGQFAEGKQITQIIQPPTSTGASPGLVFYSYISRRGNIQTIFPTAQGGVQSQPCPMYQNIGPFEAGDTIVVFTSPAANAQRNFAYSVITNTGTAAIFKGTAASGNATATHILSGASIGQALTNQTIVQHFLVSDEQGLIINGGGILLLDDRGLPRGGCVAIDPGNLQVKPNMMGTARIQLNWTIRMTCSA